MSDKLRFAKLLEISPEHDLDLISERISRAKKRSGEILTEVISEPPSGKTVNIQEARFRDVVRNLAALLLEFHFWCIDSVVRRVTNNSYTFADIMVLFVFRKLTDIETAEQWWERLSKAMRTV